jgi:hypothetical protein
MTLEEFFESKYILNDGEICSILIDYENSTNYSVKIKLKLRKSLSSTKFEDTFCTLHFENIEQVDIFEDFGTGTNYSDITLIRLNNGNFYLSLDPYDNTNLPNEKDNFIVKSSSLTITEDQG